MKGVSVSVAAYPLRVGATLAADDKEDGLAKGREHARLFLSNDERRERAEIEVVRGCEPCGSTGRVLRRRTKMTFDECRACDGTGAAEVLVRETVTRGDMEKCGMASGIVRDR